MHLIAVALFASLAAASPASQGSADASTAQAQEAKPEKAKKICRAIEVTARRVPKRECKTEAEWTAEARRDNGDSRERVRSAASGN